MLYAIAVFAPLLGSLVAGLLGREIGDRASQAVSIICMVVAAGCGATELGCSSLGRRRQPAHRGGNRHLPGGRLVPCRLGAALRRASVMMVAMVTFVATLIHVYSIGYMSHDATIPRFFSYLSLFTFAMLMLVTAEQPACSCSSAGRASGSRAIC